MGVGQDHAGPSESLEAFVQTSESKNREPQTSESAARTLLKDPAEALEMPVVRKNPNGSGPDTVPASQTKLRAPCRRPLASRKDLRKIDKARSVPPSWRDLRTNR